VEREDGGEQRSVVTEGQPPEALDSVEGLQVAATEALDARECHARHHACLQVPRQLRLAKGGRGSDRGGLRLPADREVVGEPSEVPAAQERR
jgi:hypothetical protein